MVQPKTLERVVRRWDFPNQFIDDDYLNAAPSKLYLRVALGGGCREDIARHTKATPQNSQNYYIPEIVITRAAPAFHKLFMVMGCVFNIRILCVRPLKN